MRILLLALSLSASSGLAQPTPFVSVLGGIATLSADAATRFESANAVSLYKPENGPALNIAAGMHLNDWLSVQGNYIYNRNDVVLTIIRNEARSQQAINVRQHAVVADLLVYFRGRREWVRPYLSAGVGGVRFRDEIRSVEGTLPHPGRVSAFKAVLRVAVGVDLLHKSGWAFRYSFSESISGNPLSGVLEPRGSRNLANFQNLFGFVRYF